MISLLDWFDVSVGLLKRRYFRQLSSAPLPRVITYTITWRCNAACDMCGVKNVGSDAKDEARELSAADISRIFKDPLLGRLDLIRFTGGEPFLRRDFADVVDEMIKNTKTKIYYITTNGFYSEDIFNFVERIAPKAKNLVIQLSLDAVGEYHDNTRKVRGLYERVVGTLEGLKRLRDKHRFSYGINQTVTFKSIRYLEEINRLSQRLGCDHKVYLAYEAHESDIMEGNKLNPQPMLILNPAREEIKNLYDRIERYYEETGKKKDIDLSPENLWQILERMVLKGSKDRVLFNRTFPNPRCLAMFFYLRLLPNGTIMPCTLKPTPIGNLKVQTFTEVWNSKTAREMRREVNNCKGCWVECDIVPNLMYSLGTIGAMCKERLFG